MVVVYCRDWIWYLRALFCVILESHASHFAPTSPEDALQALLLGERGKVLGKGWFPDLSSNWARHTWATIASRLDLPKEVISRGLGHSFGLSVTDIYIDFDNSKVDEANRRVIDYVLYGRDYRKEKPRH